VSSTGQAPLRRTPKYASFLGFRAPPQGGISQTQLASACLPVGRGIFEQPYKNDFFSNLLMGSY
jgi:hypothetical protein